MSQKRYQVFVSSTSLDLDGERRLVIDALLETTSTGGIRATMGYTDRLTSVSLQHHILKMQVSRSWLAWFHLRKCFVKHCITSNSV